MKVSKNKKQQWICYSNFYYFNQNFLNFKLNVFILYVLMVFEINSTITFMKLEGFQIC